jgi:SAM-dependent methyltransferase
MADDEAMNRRTHWQEVYASKQETELSWYQADASPSLELIGQTGISPDSGIIDIGGGASVLVDALIRQGYSDITVLDLSSASLEIAKGRLGSVADRVDWIVADVTTWVPTRSYALWHDRAAFHFLVDPEARAAYVERLNRALVPGGYLVLGTFAVDGPERCSGLPVARYDAQGMQAVLGKGFQLVRELRHTHVTPRSVEQRFEFGVFRKHPA